LHQILNNLRADLERQHRVVLDQIDALDVQRQQLKDLTEISATQSAQLATQAAQIDQLHTIIADKERHIGNLEAIANHREILLAEMAALRTSTSWKITAPLRWFGHQLNRIKRIVKLIPAAIENNGGVLPLVRRIITVLLQDGVRGL